MVKNAPLPPRGTRRFCHVFLRRHRKIVDDISYDYWSLCESVRTAAGPRQRVVATLGKLSDAEARPEAGWDEMRQLLEGRPAARQLRLGEKHAKSASASTLSDTPETPRWEVADVSALRVERVRDFGEAWLGLALWHRLGLHNLLGGIIGPGKEDIPWADVAAVLTTARFCAQRSELSIAEHWYERTALEDITGIPLGKINDDRLYRGLDVLALHKDRLCAHLMERYRDWFGIQFEFLIYDVTSTFFEGQAAGNTKAARGYSRDQRSDCKQVCIGLVCSPEGLPLSFEVFAGNRADVTTVEDIVRRMEEKYGQAGRVWVMDRGMVSEKNIAFLRERKARYLVGTPKAQLRDFEKQLLDHGGWSEVQDGLEARLIAHPDGKGQEQYVLCRSSARAEKERAMLARQSDRLTEELIKIDTALRRHPETDLEKLGRRIGRHQGKNPAAAKHIDVEVQRDAKSGAATGLQITTPLSKGRRSDHRHGAYLLRTNCTETDPAKLWRWYIQLTQAEAAFRTAKSDLRLRPIYHQKTERVEAHILVCFLALAQWRVLEQWMSGKGLGTCARKLVAEISTIKSMDVIIPVRRGETHAEMTVRTVARPEPARGRTAHSSGSGAAQAQPHPGRGSRRGRHTGSGVKM